MIHTLDLMDKLTLFVLLHLLNIPNHIISFYQTYHFLLHLSKFTILLRTLVQVYKIY